YAFARRLVIVPDGVLVLDNTSLLMRLYRQSNKNKLFLIFTPSVLIVFVGVLVFYYLLYDEYDVGADFVLIGITWLNNKKLLDERMDNNTENNSYAPKLFVAVIDERMDNNTENNSYAPKLDSIQR
ncbi:hypothetical protein ACJX0J_010035, partial [Zea mays]